MTDSHSTLDDEVDDEPIPDSRDACPFWESHHETCRFEAVTPGSEPCADCPGQDGTELSGPIFIYSEPGKPDICGNCGIPADEHGAKCNEWATLATGLETP
jgi:hypothetical protein